MLACRPRTKMSRLCASIWASARSRRAVRKPLLSGETSVAIRGVGVVGNRREAVLGDHHDLLTAVAACPVFPHHRFQDQNHARWEDEVVVEFLAKIGSDHRGFGWIGADTVPEIEVRQPRLAAAVGGD